MLRAKLNLNGGHWGRTEKIDKSLVDCELVDSIDDERRLRVQVVRATIESKLWKELNSTGRVERTFPVDKGASQIRAAIEKKERAIPLEKRRGLVLLLDATRLPGLCFEPIVSEFHKTNAAWTASLGFDEVWLVGPVAQLSWRLDRQAAPD